MTDELKPADLDFVRKLVKDKAGISLSEDKGYLVNSRLLPIARKHELETIEQLVARLKATGDDRITMEVVEAMTTNETSFFRDIKPFDNLRDEIIPHIIKNSKDKKLRIWCAACSSGQEPYSVAITLLENQGLLTEYEIEIIATDLNSEVLRKAETGEYSQFEVQRGLPITHLMKYFTQEKEKGEKWKANDQLKNMVKFSHVNLMEDHGDMGEFDIIFCRNVLIYFEVSDKKNILTNLSKHLKPHGTLILGSSETVNDLSDKLSQFRGEGAPGIFSLKS